MRTAAVECRSTGTGRGPDCAFNKVGGNQVGENAQEQQQHQQTHKF